MKKILSLRSISLLLKLGIVVWFGAIVWEFVQFAQSDVDVFVRDDSRPVTIEDIVCGKEDPNTRLFPVMSKLSSFVYDEKPRKIYQDWRFVYEGTEKDLKNADGDRLISGLKFAIWENKEEKKSVLVYRGTTTLIDFHANLHWLTKLTDLAIDQYEQIHLVLDHIKPYVNFELITAGHSLGGGLAQHSLYQSKDIKTAFAFNSTPVTGWSDISRMQQDTNAKGTKIYRVNEKGEVLEFFRLLMKVGYIMSPEPNVNPYVKEYRMNLKEGNLFSEHGIAAMADSLELINECEESFVVAESENKGLD